MEGVEEFAVVGDLIGFDDFEDDLVGSEAMVSEFLEHLGELGSGVGHGGGDDVDEESQFSVGERGGGADGGEAALMIEEGELAESSGGVEDTCWGDELAVGIEGAHEAFVAMDSSWWELDDGLEMDKDAVVQEDVIEPLLVGVAEDLFDALGAEDGMMEVGGVLMWMDDGNAGVASFGGGEAGADGLEDGEPVEWRAGDGQSEVGLFGGDAGGGHMSEDAVAGDGIRGGEEEALGGLGYRGVLGDGWVWCHGRTSGCRIGSGAMVVSSRGWGCLIRSVGDYRAMMGEGWRGSGEGFADDHDRSDVPGGAFETGGVVDFFVAFCEDGGLIGDGGIDGDAKGMDGVREAGSESERAQAVVCGERIKPQNRYRFRVDGGVELAAVGSEEVVESGVGAFESEGEGFAGLCGGVEIGEESGKGTGEGVVGGEFLEAFAEGGMGEGDEFGGFVVVRCEGGGEFTRGGGGQGVDFLEGADDGFGVEAVTGVIAGVDAIGGEDQFVFGSGDLLGGHAFGFHDHVSGGGESDDFEAHVDGGDGVVVGDLFHGGGGAGELAVGEGGDHGVDEGIDEADIDVGVVFPGLSDDAFDAFMDLGGVGAGVVDGELDEDEVGVVSEDVAGEAEDAEVGAGAADGGIDFGDGGVGELGGEPFCGLGAPPVGGGDGAAEVGDGEGLFGVEPGEGVGETCAGVAFDGGGGGRGVIGGGGRGSDSEAEDREGGDEGEGVHGGIFGEGKSGCNGMGGRTGRLKDRWGRHRIVGDGCE